MRLGIFFVPRRGERGRGGSLSNRWQARRGPTGRKAELIRVKKCIN